MDTNETSRPRRPSHLYETCLEQAKRMARDWVPLWLDGLRSALVQGGELKHGKGVPDARLLEQALRVLAREREPLQQTLIGRLDHAWHARSLAAECEARNASRSSGQSGLDIDRGLSLIPDEELHVDLAQSRVLQLIKLAISEELVNLQAMVCGLRGLEHVRADANPLCAERIVESIVGAMGDVCGDEAVKSLWLQAGAPSLAKTLTRFYSDMNALLERWRVQPAAYQVTQVTMAHRVARVPVAGEAPAPVRAQPAPESMPVQDVTGADSLLDLQQLEQLLAGNLGQAGQMVAGRRLGGASNGMARALASEIVSLMVRETAQNPNVQEPVKDMVRRMKPTLLQIAKTDPGFFADRDNAARRLLRAITSRCEAFQSEQDTGFAPFAQAVHDAVRSLNQTGLPLAQRVEAQADALSVPLVGRTHSMADRIPLDELARSIAGEISVREDFARAPVVVRRFLTGPWSHAIAHAQHLASEALTGRITLNERQGTAALRYRDVVPDVLWSSQLHLSSRNRPRLIHLIAHVLRTLREGLDSIDHPRQQSEGFFQALMGLHEAAYRTRHRTTANAQGMPDTLATREQMALDEQDAFEADYELMSTWVPMGEGVREGNAQIDTAFQMVFGDTLPMTPEWANATQGSH